MILDPNTGLPTELSARVAALSDWLSDDRVLRTLLRRRVASPYGLEKLKRLIDRTAYDVQSPPSLRTGVGQGRNERWWQQYQDHITKQMAAILRDRVVRRVLSSRVMKLTGRSRHECMEELARLRVDIETAGSLPS